MSEISYGYGHVRVGDDEELVAPNYPVSPVLLEAIFNDAIGSNYGPYHFAVMASPFFNRYSALRYRRDANVVILGKPFNIAYQDSGYNVWMDNTVATGMDRATGQKYFNRTQIATTVAPMAVGSINMAWYDRRYLSQNRWLPNDMHLDCALSSIDVPGTQIGQIFKHPISRSHIFNEIGIVALSQGAANIEGVYAPEENKAYTMAYRVYIAKSGGTGKIEGATKTNGETFPAATNNYTFKDATFAGFVPGDVGKYIAIRSGNNIGTYLITARIDASTVETDAATINEAFTNEPGLTWTLRTGPIGEYFFQKRRWAFYPYWNPGYMTYSYHSNAITHMHQELPVTHRTTDIGAVHTSTTRCIHDRGACFWWITPTVAQEQGEVGLLRWKMACLEGWDYPVAYNSFSGLSMPVGVYNWRDIAIDPGNKLWIGWENGTDNYRLMKVDPYPGGNSKNPEILGRYQKQTSAADATGLCTSKVRGIVCTDGGVVYVFHNTDGTTVGGISYTADGGTTWKRLHILAAPPSGGTITSVTADTGGSIVAGSGTNFSADFAAGDWIRIGSDTRSYEIKQIDSAAQLLLVDTGVTKGAGSYAIQKGALLDAQSRLYYGLTESAWNVADLPCRPPCDFDTNGNVYWISTDQAGVYRWNPTDGKVTSVTNAKMSMGYAFSLPKTLCVTRFYDVAGSGTNATFNNNVWVGSHATDLARIYDWDGFRTAADGVTNGTTTFTAASGNFTTADVGKWISITTKGTYYITARISSTQVTLNTTVSAGSSLTWELWPVTRYNYQYSSSNFPVQCDVVDHAGVHYNTQVTQDRVTGQIYYFSHSNYNVYEQLCLVLMYPGATLGTLSSYGTATGPVQDSARLTQTVPSCAMFDDIGLGSSLAPGWWYYLDNMDSSGWFHGILHSPGVICFRWNGSTWAQGRLNMLNANISFATTPYLDAPASLGAGLKRVHEYAAPLDSGLTIKFTQAGGATLQANEYIVDETVTFLGIIGSAKDNTQTADIGCDSYVYPTAYRVDEPVHEATSPWTTNDGGVDGGYIASATVGAMPVHMRGFAEGCGYDSGNGAGTVTYPLTTSFAGNSPANTQYMASLRIKDEYAPDTADGTIPGVGDTFTKGTGLGRDWDSGDLYKTIFVEGSSSGNNGRYVITEILTADNVRVHRSFAAAESVRWKLRDVPAVGYVMMQYYYAQFYYLVLYGKHRLYSSGDHGQNWDLVKGHETFSGCSPNDPLTTYKSSGIRFDTGTQGYYYGSNSDQTSCSMSVIYDLRNLSQVERRKQYWKAIRLDSGSGGGTARPASIVLLDENFKRLGIPEDCRVTDFFEPLLNGALPMAQRLVPYDSVDNAVGVDKGYGDWTDEISAPLDSFFDDSGTDGVTSGSNFSSVSAAFTISDVGKSLRIPAEGGFCTITAIVSSTSVTTDKSFTGGSGRTWALTRFAKDDYVVFKEYTASYGYLNRPLVEFQFKILDVPTNTTIQFTTKNVPLDIDFPFYVFRTPGSILTFWTTDGWHSTGANLFYNHKVGMHGVNEVAEFNVIHSGSSATPKADTDGDGRTDEVVLTVDLNTEAVAGDVIVLYKDTASLASRYYEIRSINRLGGGVTDVRVHFDEIIPGTGPYKWKVLRRRGMKVHFNRVEVITQEALP